MFKKWAQEWSGPDEPIAVPLRLASGAGAGIVAVSATYPLDLVRARLSIATANMASSSKHGFTSEDAKLGIVGMTKKVYATEGGIRGL
jgi:solute carrier family 25 phosphate transporter 23/24/25/41